MRRQRDPPGSETQSLDQSLRAGNSVGIQKTIAGHRLPERFAKHKELKLVNLRIPVKQKPRREVVRDSGGCESRRHPMAPFLATVLSNNDSQPGAVLLPRGHVAMSRDIFGHLSLQGWVPLLASSESRSEVLLNFRRFTGQPFTTKNYRIQSDSAKAEKFCSRDSLPTSLLYHGQCCFSDSKKSSVTCKMQCIFNLERFINILNKVLSSSH